jgi:conjugal transfer ATP-binding protein TraC
MGIFSFGNNPKNEAELEQLKKEEAQKTVKDWVPVKTVRDGIVHLKNGEYVKILEIIPVNFKLKSKAEKRMLILSYRAFLKGCRFPMQISIQCRKANIDPHITRMKSFYNIEKNPNVKTMIKGYINLVTDIGTQGTITRRYFLVYPYVKPPGVSEISYNDVLKQMKEKNSLVKEYLFACGNEVLDHADTEFAVNVLYSYFNKRTCEVQRIGKKLVSLMGTFLDASEEPYDDSEEEE